MQNNNFNLLRLIASMAVLYGHGFVLQGHLVPIGMIHELGVNVFFAISGYLIATSWQNDPNIVRYFWRRALRIFPALVVTVLFTILVLGPIFSPLSLGEYWSHAQTMQYLNNIVLYISYNLPLVFAENTFPHTINGSLWTLPVEFFMYITVAVFGVICMNNRWVALGIFASWLTLYLCWEKFGFGNYVIYATLMKPLAGLGALFWGGVVIQRWKIDRYFSMNSFSILLLAWIFVQQWQAFVHVAQYFVLPFLALAFGSASAGRLSIFNKADYSYGVYIYAFPVQQSLIALFPELSTYASIACSAVITLSFAAFSWHRIENPMLRFKPRRKLETPIT